MTALGPLRHPRKALLRLWARMAPARGPRLRPDLPPAEHPLRAPLDRRLRAAIAAQRQRSE